MSNTQQARRRNANSTLALVARVNCCAAGLLLLCLMSWAVAPAAADEGLPSETSVTLRVLLLETQAAVRVKQAAATVELAPGRGGLLADGRAVGRVWRPAGHSPGGIAVDGLRVRGRLEVRRMASGLAVINTVDLEDYVVGTIAREVYSTWHPELLKAQAVVTRTYALHQAAQNRRREFDVQADTSSQVYGGRDAENGAVLQAGEATRGEFLAWNRQPILAVFHSSSGGQTATAEEVWGEAVPYLQSIEVPNEEDSPDTYWRVSVSRAALGQALVPLGIGVGEIREIAVSERSKSGRATGIRVRGTQGAKLMEARALRTALGASLIRSTLFEIRERDDGFVFVGSGHGHGVGMSQWGAQAMAKAGANYRAILAAFFPGTQLAQGAQR